MSSKNVVSDYTFKRYKTRVDVLWSSVAKNVKL